MITYPAEFLGCPVGGQNGQSPKDAATVTARLKGRPVYRYKDANPKDITTLHFLFDRSQFSGWTSFWRAIGNGLTPFRIDVLMGALPAAETQVQATGPWSSTLNQNGLYDVSLPVQVLE